VFAQAVVLLPLTVLSLRLFGFQKTRDLLAAWVPADVLDDAAVDREHVRATARMMRFALAGGFIHASCLPRSLVLWFLLRRQRIQAHLRIGVRKEQAELDAHAWVECLGVIANDRRRVSTRWNAFDGLSPVTKS